MNELPSQPESENKVERIEAARAAIGPLLDEYGTHILRAAIDAELTRRRQVGHTPSNIEPHTNTERTQDTETGPRLPTLQESIRILERSHNDSDQREAETYQTLRTAIATFPQNPTKEELRKYLYWLEKQAFGQLRNVKLANIYLEKLTSLPDTSRTDPDDSAAWQRFGALVKVRQESRHLLDSIGYSASMPDIQLEDIFDPQGDVDVEVVGYVISNKTRDAKKVHKILSPAVRNGIGIEKPARIVATKYQQNATEKDIDESKQRWKDNASHGLNRTTADAETLRISRWLGDILRKKPTLIKLVDFVKSHGQEVRDKLFLPIERSITDFDTLEDEQLEKFLVAANRQAKLRKWLQAIGIMPFIPQKNMPLATLDKATFKVVDRRFKPQVNTRTGIVGVTKCVGLSVQSNNNTQQVLPAQITALYPIDLRDRTEQLHMQAQNTAPNMQSETKKSPVVAEPTHPPVVHPSWSEPNIDTAEFATQLTDTLLDKPIEKIDATSISAQLQEMNTLFTQLKRLDDIDRIKKIFMRQGRLFAKNRLTITNDPGLKALADKLRIAIYRWLQDNK